MSGHSKWSTIKRQKGAADQKRGALFTKLANSITAAAREGGDPQFNFKLRLAIDAAKAANMPKDNVERAIKRGTGELTGIAPQEIIYEAYGPGGVALIIETLTDNKNRTVSSIKHALNKYGGSLGAANSVLWMFQRRGLIIATFNEAVDRETTELRLIDAGAEELEWASDLQISVIVQPDKLEEMKTLLESMAVIDTAQLIRQAKEEVALEALEQVSLEKLLTQLEDDQDIIEISTNAKD